MPIFFFISLVTYITYISFKCSDGLIELEKLEFSSKKYFNYIKNNAKKIFFTPEILSIILIIIAVNANEKITGISTVILYMFLTLYLIFKKKEKLSINKSVSFVIIGIVIFYLLLFGFISYDYYITHSSFLVFDYGFIYYILVVLAGYFVYFIILLSNVIVNLLKKIPKKGKNKKIKKEMKKKDEKHII